MGQLWQCTVYIHVCLQSCRFCSGISGSYWGWQSSELLVVNPKVLLCHHNGNDGACTQTSSDNISTSQTMWFHGEAKEAVTVLICPATTTEGRSRDMYSIYEGAVELAAKLEVQPSKACWKTKRPRKCSCWCPLSVLEDGNSPIIHGPLAVGNEHTTDRGLTWKKATV